MLVAGTRVGPYEVVAWLGAGGMGEVYRARDTKLSREVALKTLPEEFARQPDRLARLRQEARILASLNHPGIATLHGLEEAEGGVPVLVMELVEGETLADRLRRGPLPPREALGVAQQIALALEAAHQKGVLHRDLKPGNIRLSPEGRVKLLDFGLAKVVREAILDSRLDTHTSPPNEAGAVLGTAPYMSPEQARGQELDRRSDVWSFGCVLFEMLAGTRAFEGATFSDAVAAVLDREPIWTKLPGETPLAVRRLLRRCLQKEKDQRLRDIGDARLELEEVLTGAAPAGEAFPLPRRRPAWPAITILSAVIVALLSWVLLRPPSARKDVLRLSFDAPGLPGERVWRSPALSPAGDRIVYRTVSGLVVRDLAKPEGRLIPGSARYDSPFFSPDGTWIGFTSEGSLKKVSLGGSAPLTLCPGVSRFGATWGPDDTIVFTPNSASGLWQVPASGGEPRELTKPDRARGEKTHRWPLHLPGGQAVLFTVGGNRLATYDDARIEVLLLPTGERRTILEGGTAAAYVESGHLVYRRGPSILAASFDVARLAVTGDPVAVVEGVHSEPVRGGPSFTVARTGMLGYVPHESSGQRLVRVDRAGTARPLTPFVEFLDGPRVSPDGSAIAVVRMGANDQVWRYDFEREAFSQVTFEWDSSSPVWTPDGESLIVSSTPGWRLHRVRADGSGPAEPLSIGTGRQNPGSFAPDGKSIAYHESGTNTGEDIWVVPLEPPAEPRAFLQTPARELWPAISPSGHLIAYMSDESGQFEVYLRSFPDGGNKIQVSSGGGGEPVWARSGRELFYSAAASGSKSRMMVVDIGSGSPVRVSRGHALFEHRFPDGLGYDVFPDGQHFVMIENEEQATRVAHFNVVLNWFEELTRLVPPR